MGGALAQNGAVTFNGDGGNLSVPAAPQFTSIVRTGTNSVTGVLNTAPYFVVTLQSTTNLALPNWSTIATNDPTTSLWTFTNATTATNQFYRAFISAP